MVEQSPKLTSFDVSSAYITVSLNNREVHFRSIVSLFDTSKPSGAAISVAEEEHVVDTVFDGSHRLITVSEANLLSEQGLHITIFDLPSVHNQEEGLLKGCNLLVPLTDPPLAVRGVVRPGGESTLLDGHILQLQTSPCHSLSPGVLSVDLNHPPLCRSSDCRASRLEFQAAAGFHDRPSAIAVFRESPAFCYSIYASCVAHT